MRLARSLPQASIALADEVAQRCFAVQDTIGAVQAQDLRSMHATICAKCGGGPKTTRFRGRRSPGRWSHEDVCASCGKPWEEDEDTDKVVLRVKRKRSEGHVRPDVAESILVAQLDEWRLLRRIVYNRPRNLEKERWDFSLLAWRLYLHPQVGSYESAAAFGREHAHRFREWWTLGIVWFWVDRARENVAARIGRLNGRDRARLLQGAT